MEFEEDIIALIISIIATCIFVPLFVITVKKDKNKIKPEVWSQEQPLWVREYEGQRKKKKELEQLLRERRDEKRPLWESKKQRLRRKEREEKARLQMEEQEKQKRLQLEEQEKQKRLQLEEQEKRKRLQTGGTRETEKTYSME